jgi:hypothetical protein
MSERSVRQSNRTTVITGEGDGIESQARGRGKGGESGCSGNKAKALQPDQAGWNPERLVAGGCREIQWVHPLEYL